MVRAKSELPSGLPAVTHARTKSNGRWPLVLAALALAASIGLVVSIWPTEDENMKWMAEALAPPAAPDSSRTPVVLAQMSKENGGRWAADRARLANYLEAQAPCRIRIRFADGAAEYYNRINRGEYDLMIMGPLEYVEARERCEIEPLVAVLVGGKRFYHGMIVSVDPAIRRIADLRRRRVTFVDATSASGYLFPLALLLENGIDPNKDCSLFEPSGGHGDVIFNLRQHRYDAGFTLFNPKNLQGDPLFSEFHIVDTSAPIPTAVIAVTRRFKDRSPEILERLRKAFLDANTDSKTFLDLSLTNPDFSGFVTATDTEYDPVRRVRATLTRYRRLPE